MNNIEYISNGDEWIQAPGATLIAVSGSGGGGGKGSSGGGGGTPRAAVEAANTLQASAVVKVVEVLAEGQIEGLCGGAKGIYINDTPLQNSDGSYNFTKVLWDYRVGLPSQDYMQGFSNVEAEISVATPVTAISNNIVRTTSAGNIDAIKVTIQLPNGLTSQNTTNGDINGYAADIRIDKKLTSSGTWTVAGYYEISGKTTTAYEVQYLIDRIGTSGTWDIRVVRLNPDPPATIHNETRFERMTEIQYVQLAYNDTAYVGISIAAESVGNSIPKRAYLVKGTRVQIPSNYNPITRVYSGTWNGTFTTAWTDNPAWCLYDMLTNVRYGMGEFISASDIDKYSFYDAGVYNDVLVPDGAGGYEPRYTLNCRISAQDQFWRIAQLVAGNMRSNLLWVNNKYMVIQDRPSSAVKTVSKDNVINGKFKRKSSAREERHTAFNVTWNNRADRHLQVVSTVEDTTGIARYGYYPTDIAAYGATTEGQAIRAGKWAMYTELNQVHQLSFEMTFDGFDLLPGDVIKVLDEDWANIQQAGRTTAIATSNNIVLDRAITLTTSSTISVNLPDGTGMQTRSIVETTGTLSSINVSTPFSMTLPAYTQFIIETATVFAKQYKIINVKQTDINVVEVQCVEHEPAKYAYVETGVAIPTLPFSNAVTTKVGVPTGITFSEESVLLPDGNTQRNIRAAWSPPQGTIRGYTINYRLNLGDTISVTSPVPRVLVDATKDGSYVFDVYAIDFNGNTSGIPLTGTYVLDSTTTSATVNAVTDLYVTGTAGVLWSTNDLSVSWNDDPANISPTTAYKVDILTSGGTLLQTEVVYNKTYLYPLDKNIADGGPRGALQVRVYARDTANRYGPSVAKVFTNPAPAAVTGLSITGSFKSMFLNWDSAADNDVVGYLLWRDTTLGFTPSSANLITDMNGTAFTDSALPDSTTYFYKIAAYDIFNKSLTGAGLNVTASGSVTTLDPNNTNEYLLNGVTWTPNSPSTNSVAWSAATMTKLNGTGAGTQWAITAGNAAWTSGVLYVYYTEGNTTLQTTTTVTTAIANNKIIVATYRGGTNLEVGNGKAYLDGGFIIAGTIAAAQLVTGTAVITQSAQIANGIIDNANILNATIDTLKLKNGSVTSFATSRGTTFTQAQITVGSPSPGALLTSGTNSINVTYITPTPSGLSGPYNGIVEIYVASKQTTNVPILVSLKVTIDFYNSSGTYLSTSIKSVNTTLSGTLDGTTIIPLTISNAPGEKMVIATLEYTAYTISNAPLSTTISIGPISTMVLVNLRS